MGQASTQFLTSLAAVYLILVISPVISDMTDSFDKVWGNTQVLDSTSHQIMPLTLGRWTTSEFRSKSLYLFGIFDMDIKLVPKDSAGTVTTIYVSKQKTKKLIIQVSNGSLA
jgi:hypothetical protein